MSLPRVLVTCATGSSSSLVVKALSASGKFRVRATGRNIESVKKAFNGLPNVEFAALDSTPSSAQVFFFFNISFFHLLSGLLFFVLYLFFFSVLIVILESI